MKTIFIPAGLMLAVVFLSGCGPTTVRTAPDEAAVELEAKRQMEFALREQLNKQERLQNVGWPVLEAGLPLCVDRKRWAIGAFYANQHDFPKELQETAVSMLGGGEDLQILTLVRDSPAAASGLQKGDVIISVNAKNVPAGKDASGKFSDLLKQELENGKAVDFVVRREGVQETASITPVEICDYPLALLNQNVVNAYADGNNIVVFSGLMDFARTDQELSLVLAHELSHNAMRHIDAKKVNFFIGFLFDILVIGVTGVDLGIRNATALA
ncbi:MAG: M48 family metalloprotease, partial [Gammaproteobacteria bacterium]